MHPPQPPDRPPTAPRSTARCHLSRWRGFAAYCAQLGLDVNTGRDLERLTRSEREALFTNYALHQLTGGTSGRPLASETVRIYLGTIQRLVTAGHPQVAPEEFGPALRIARAHDTADPTTAPPQLLRPGQITPTQMRHLVDVLDLQSLRGRLDAAVLTLHCALDTTGQETAALHISDQTMKFGVGLTVQLARPAETPTSAREIIVPYGRDSTTCPVLAVQAWQRDLALRGITQGPLFQPVDRHGNVGTRAAGRHTATGAIAASYPGKVLYRTAAAAGLLNALGVPAPARRYRL